MTIDERLEAVTRNLELTAQMQQKNEEQIGKLTRSTRRLERMALMFAGEFHTRLQRLEEQLDREDDAPAGETN